MYSSSNSPIKRTAVRVCNAPTCVAGIKLVHVFLLLSLFAFGVAVGVALWYGFLSVQHEEEVLNFASRASSMTFLLQTLIDQGITEAQSFASVLSMYPTFNTTTLNAYVNMFESVLKEPDMITLMYLPRVPVSEVDVFLKAVHVYDPTFKIDSDQTQTTDANSSFYPVYFVSHENTEIAQQFIGDDLYNISATLHAYIETAVSTQQLVVASPLMIDDVQIREIVLFIPLRNEVQGPIGVVLGVVNITMMLELVYDSVPDADKLIIYPFIGQHYLLNPSYVGGPQSIPASDGLIAELTVRGPGLNWTIVYTPKEDFTPRYDSVWPSVLMAIICLFVLIVAVFLFVQIRNHGKFKKLTSQNVVLLNKILPPAISKRLGKGETFIADHLENTSIFFMDISGFTEFSSNHPAAEVVGTLDEMFSRLDIISTNYNVEKIKTIGDSYMAVTGLFNQPHETAQNNAERMVGFALEAVTSVSELFQSKSTTAHLSVRIGIHSGPVVAGVTGRARPHYDVWGDSVNVASRMESTGVPGHVHISERTYELVYRAYECTKRPEPVYAKGKGNLQTYLVVKKSDSAQVTLNVDLSIDSPGQALAGYP